jgi:hypothetical protein
MGDLTEFLKSQNVSPDGLLIPTKENYVKPSTQPLYSRYNTTSVDDLKPIDYEADSNFSDLADIRNDLRAETQSSISKIGNTLGQGLGTFLTATLSTAGTLAGAGAGAIGQIGDAITGQDNTDFMDTMLNNPLNQSISELDKYIKEDLLPTYYTQEQQESLISAATGTELVNGLGFMLSAMIPGAGITKALGGISKLGTMAKLGTLEANVAKSIAMGAMKAETGQVALALGKFMSKVPAVTGAVVGRIGESAMEANQTYESLIAEGIDEETAKRQRDNVFYGNMALAASDVAQYTRWFKPNPFERIIKNTAEKGIGYAVKQVGKKEAISEILKESSQEAGEEGIQFLLQKGAEKAAKEPGKYSFGTGVLGSMNELFTTVEGQKSMLLGAVLGGGVGTILKGVNSKQVNAQLQSTVDELNANPTFSNEKFIKNAEGKYILNPEFVKAQTVYANLEAKREEAIAKGDLESAELIDKLQFNNLVASRVQANKFDDLIEELEVMGKATDVELEQYFGQVPTDKQGNKMSASQIATTKIEEAKALKRNIESLRLIPQFQNLSTPAFNLLTETTIRQDAINRQIQDVDKQLSNIAPDFTTGELTPPNKVRLDSLTETRKALVDQYTSLNKTLELFTAKPEKLEKKADEIAEKTNKAFETKIDDEIKTSIEADEVIENGIKNGTPITIKNADGTTKTVTYQDGNYVEQDGIFVEETEVKQGVINELNEQNSADVIDNDIDDVEESTINYSIKKPNIHSSSTQGHNFKKNSDGTIDRTEKQKETTVAGKIIYQLNGLFKRFVEYSSKALNTPLVRKATSEPTTYSFVATIGEVTDEELNSINSDRAFFAKENNVSLPPVTREDLMSNPAFIPISLQLQANGKNVGGAVTRMHNPDYIYRTQEFDAIMENENIVDKQGAIDSLLEQYTTYRKQLIDKIKTGQKVNLLVDTKSGGIMNVTPMIDGKMQVNPITDTFKHINEYESGLYVDNVQLMPNGIGVVTEIDEKGNGVIEFSNGNKGIVANANLGEMIFQTIDAGANIVNIRALSKNKLSDEQLNSLVDLIYYKLSTGENTITVNGKEQTIVGNQSVGRGIVDSLILIAARQNKEKQIFFKKNGSLVVGRKEFTFEDSPEVVKQAIYETLLAGNNEVNFKKDIKPDSDFMLPALIDGEWKGKTTTYNDYIFGGENPLIGTFVDSETPFINSYYGYKMDENGYVTDPIEETKPEPIYVIDVDFDDEGRAMPTYSTEPEVKVVTDARDDIEQFNVAKEGALKRIKNSTDPQTIFSEINEMQEALKISKNFVLTPEEQTFIDKKLKELKDKGYTFKTKKGEILREGENIKVREDPTLLRINDVTEVEKPLIEKELNRRKEFKKKLIENGYSEKEAIIEAKLSPDENIDIVSKDIEVAVLKNGIQEKSGKVSIRFITIKNAELAALESKPETVDNSEIIKIQEDMKQDADESINDCNGKTPALPDGKNLSGKANKYKKK